jgi:hypothetical protein
LTAKLEELRGMLVIYTINDAWSLIVNDM